MSFILSLAFVSRRDRERRTEHDSGFRLQSRYSWSAWKNWAAPEPYQQFKMDGNPRQDPDSSAWFIRKKRTAVTKMQFDDAWNLHSFVMALIIFGIAAICAGVYVLSTWIWIRWKAG
jgi:hypothetical protein